MGCETLQVFQVPSEMVSFGPPTKNEHANVTSWISQIHPDMKSLMCFESH